MAPSALSDSITDDGGSAVKETANDCQNFEGATWLRFSTLTSRARLGRIVPLPSRRLFVMWEAFAMGLSKKNDTHSGKKRIGGVPLRHVQEFLCRQTSVAAQSKDWWSDLGFRLGGHALLQA